MPKSLNPYINQTDLAINPSSVTPEIDDKLLQAFVRALGWDNNNNIWRKMLTDVDGRLLVSTSVTQGATANQLQTNLPIVTTQILAANGSRRLVIIQNLGATAIYIGFGVNATVAGGMQIPAGGVFIDDHFTGAINGIAVTAPDDIRVVEF